MKTRSYQQCTRCVMDTSDPEITFGESGHCNHCTEFLNRRSKHKYNGTQSDQSLIHIFDRIKRAGKGREYDCVIGLSGGADSCYLALIAKESGLRPLAVHMDNGWNSEKAVSNIRNIAEKLEIDYESYVLDWEEFKDLQLSFLKASVPEAETPTDIAIPGALHYFAAKQGIKYIMSGGNQATEGILPKSWHYNARDLKYFNHIQNTFGQNKLKTFPTFGYKAEMYYKLIKGIRMVYPLNYVPFVKADAIKILQDRFDWKDHGGKHHESGYTKFIQSYYLFEKFGIDYRRAGLAVQICNGEISRTEANEQLEVRPYVADETDVEISYIAKKFGIPRNEFLRIVNLPAKWYWDYPNEDKKLGRIYDAYRFVFRKEKLANF